VKVVTYNIQYGLGKDNRYDLARIAREIEDADVIALQATRLPQVEALLDIHTRAPSEGGAWCGGHPEPVAGRRGHDARLVQRDRRNRKRRVEAHRLAGGGTIQAVVDACRAAIAEAEAAVEPASASCGAQRPRLNAAARSRVPAARIAGNEGWRFRENGGGSEIPEGVGTCGGAIGIGADHR
jgi:hypothetical protein